MRRALLVLLSLSCADCAEEEKLFPNVFAPPPPAEEVECADAGAWETVLAPIEQGLGDVWGARENELWAVGARGAIIRFDGTRWSDATPNLTGADLLSVHGTAADDVWAVGRGGTVLRYDGRAWASVPADTTADLISVWATERGTVWIAGSEGALRWDGDRVARPAGAPAGALNAVWASGPRDVWMIGKTVFHHFDGAAFTSQPIEQAGSLAALWGVDATRVWAIGHSTSMQPGFAELGADRQWVFDAAPPRAVFFSLWSFDGAEIWLGASDTSIFRRTGGQWCREYLGGVGAANAFFGFTARDIWAVGAKRGAGGQQMPLLLRRRR